LALESLKAWANGKDIENTIFTLVNKEEITKNGSYNLSRERYKAEVISKNSKWPRVKLGEILTLEYGKPLKQEDRKSGPFLVYGSNGVVGTHNSFLVEGPFIIVGRKGSAGAVNWSDASGFPIDTTFYVSLKDKNLISLRYLYYMLKTLRLNEVNTQSGVPGLNRNDAYDLEIPLPPLEVQAQVAELDGYAAIISGAKQIVENWKPRIDIDPEWETRELGDVCEVYQPKTITGAEILDDGPFKVYGANGVIGYYDKFNHEESEVAITCRGATCGTVNFTEPESWITGNAMVVSPKDKTISKKFLQYLLIGTDLNPVITGSAQPQITGASLKPFEIPIPPIDEQDRIVKLIDAEGSQVDSAKKLIETYEARTQAVIAKLWSE
jgi:restriction endonuclease S subunit